MRPEIPLSHQGVDESDDGFNAHALHRLVHMGIVLKSPMVRPEIPLSHQGVDKRDCMVLCI